MSTDGRIESLQGVEQACWQGLSQAAADRGDDWRTLVLATVDGERADARIVILREVDAPARELLFYTDGRSPKVAQLQRCPQATLLAWSARRAWQLRIGARLRVATDGLEVSSRWARLKLSPSASDYLSPLPPGAPIGQSLPDLASRSHFAVVVAAVESIDWLELHAAGQRRACFDAHGARWLQP
jgi:pyridoxamine 5'-phosphate oxidase